MNPGGAVLRYCVVEPTELGCVTYFEDGSRVSSHAHTMPHYHVIAHRCGYGDDLARYCFEHDVAHSFVEQELYGIPSRVLFALAKGKPLTGAQAAYEECMAQAFQAFVRANVRPIIGGVRWDDMKARFIEIVDGHISPTEANAR